MSLIELKASRCVRSLSKDSECNKCEIICPTSAINIGLNPLPSINYSLCVGCGACDGICPNEALILSEFNSTDFFFSFLEDSESLISCRKNVPCISALSVENIISLAIIKNSIDLDMGHCSECHIASTCKGAIEKNAEEASYILEAMESTCRVNLVDISYNEVKTSDRREFLNSINLTSVAKVKKSFENEVQKASDELIEHTLEKDDIALLKKKRVTDRRKLLFTAIKRVSTPSTFHIVDANEITFTSSKLIDDSSCTACQMCYRVCPTGALTSDVKNSKIDFDPFLCIKCNTCHDVCEPNSLSISSSYRVEEFFSPEVKNLITFSVQKCNECDMIFSTNNGDKLCYRCKAEDEQARELWGITE